ncbi:MAG: prenyltransferase [Candidatus Zhuqueibacterota bacterium]
MEASRNRAGIWWQAFRFHFVPPSFLPAILGSFVAWAATGEFSLWYYAITVLGVTLNHIALNMTDDYFDYLHSVDRAKDREKNPYSGGSGTLTGGLITPQQLHRVFITFYIITIALGLYLSISRGWLVFAFGAFGMGCAYFYTAPPIRYGYRGWGEFSQLINFSVTIGMGAYFVQTLTLSTDALWVLLPLGFMMFAMITINEIPDEEDDRSSGKRNLVVRFGIKTAVWLYGASMAIAFLIILLAPWLSAATLWIYISFVTLPWFVKAFRILYRNYTDPVRMSPANMLTIRVHNMVGILLIVAYLAQGISRWGSNSLVWGALIILFLLYLPVGLTIFFNVLLIKPGEKK